MEIGFIGLGVMGFPTAVHLSARGGHKVTVYNRSREKAVAWVAAHGGSLAETPADCARGKDLVFACVGNDHDLRAITIGRDGAFTMREGSVFVDHTTTSAQVARELHAIAAVQGVGFVDAPVSGGQIGAQNGVLTVMCGGDADDVAKAEPVIAHYARLCRHLGPVGSGQLAKMVNQLCIAGVVQGLAEGMHFAQRAGLPVAAVMETLGKGAAGSWQMENRAETMAEGRYDFGFAVDWMLKDLGICLAEGARNGVDLPLAALVDGFYADVQAMGGGRWDTSSLLARLNARDVKPPFRPMPPASDRDDA